MVMLNDEREHVYRLNNPLNMKVVRNWAKLVEENIVNVDKSKPKIVVGSEIITSIRSAQKVGEELSRANCKQVIMCYNVWDFPFMVWPFLNSLGRDIPILSLSNNNGKYPGNVGLLATDGALRQAGFKTHRIVGEIGDEVTQRKIFDWLRASQAVTIIKNEVYGSYGGHSMGMETGYFHLVPTIKTLGVTVRQIDQLLLREEMSLVDENEVKKGFDWFTKLLGEKIKYDGKMLTSETLKNQLRLYLAVRKINEGKGFDFCGIKGQRELTEYVCLADVAEMLLNDPYDWRGPKETTVCATEADSYAAITMQLLKYISAGLPTLFMDVRLYHPDRDIWDLCNSGNHASFYAQRSFVPEDNFKYITFYPAMEFYFKAGGASVFFDACPGELTFARLGLWDDRPYLVMVRGEVVDLSDEERKKLDAQTDPTWPHVHAHLFCDYEEFINVFPSNHIVAVEGNHLESLNYLAEIVGIKSMILGEEGKKRRVPVWERV